MDTLSWGPQAWRFLHSITFAYPVKNPSDAQKKQTKEFFTYLQFLLPCPECKQHYSQLLILKPIDNALDSQDSLSRWLVNIHNQVNKRLGKPEMPYEIVKDKYEALKGMCQLKLPVSGSEYVSDMIASSKSSSALCNKHLMILVMFLVLTLCVSAFILIWKR